MRDCRGTPCLAMTQAKASHYMFFYIFVLTILLIVIPMLPSTPALAKPPDTAVLNWAIVDTPGSTADKNDLRSPCELNAVAVAPDGKTIYAIDIPNAAPPPVANPGLWKSSDGGVTWSSKPTQHLSEATPSPILPVTDIALAPDNPDLVAVVCLNNTSTLRHEVYLSHDGGSSWYYTGTIPWVYGGSEQIGDIAISPGYNLDGKPSHDIIAGSRQPDDSKGEGEIYILTYPGFGSWKAQGFTSDDIIAIDCSPNYTSDFSLVTLASTTERTYICLGYRDVAANACTWNTDAGWPVEMCPPDQIGGTASGEDRIITGDIGLPSNFVGTSRSQRVIFAAYDSNGTAQGASQVLDDVYRLDNTIVNRLKLPGCGSSTRISTIAYAGNTETGKLLAGEVSAKMTEASARVWVCHDPLSSCPTWRLSTKPPTGGGKDGYANAQLAWASKGSIAFCTTGCGNRDTPQKWANPTDAAWSGQSLDESAVSITEDSGDSWNQIGLIDTRIDRFKDVAAAEGESTLYLASVNDAGFDSLWRSQSPILGDSWQRVMCINGQSPILRLAPDTRDGAAMFWGNQGTDVARCSTNHGQTWHDCLPNVTIQDMAAADSQTLYILQADGRVRRGSYTDGWRWARNVDSGLTTGHTIAVRDDNILVGAATSESSPLAYSSDNGLTWAKIAKETPSTGNRHAAFDSYFDKNQIIYVADDAGGIYRWTIGRSNSWDDLAPPNHSFYGIVIGNGGAAYGAYSSTESGVDRALYPRSGIPKPSIFWDSLTTGLASSVQFSTEPSSINISQSSLWVIDARGYNPPDNEGCLWAFTDTLARAGPRLLEPEKGAALGCDPVSGRNQEVDLRGEQLSLADEYEIQVAKDKAFSLRVTEAEPQNNPFYEPDSVTSPAYRITPGMLPEAGTTYYWRARVRHAATGQTIRSQWSEMYSFSIKAGLPVVSPYLGAQALKPGHDASKIPVSPIAFSWTAFNEATEYNFVLAEDSALKNIVAKETVPTTAYEYGGELDYGTSYFWQVTANKPVPSEPSPVFSFTTEARPVPVPVSPSPALQQVLHWLQASILINILGFITLLAAIFLCLKKIKG